MKIKKVISICRQSGYVYLYDGDIQLLGDGVAFYYLMDCPEFSVSTLLSTYDISEKQADNLVCNCFAAVPTSFSVTDILDGEKISEPLGLDIGIRGKQYRPYKTTTGITYIDVRYLDPFLSDGDNIELYERKNSYGKQYFAIKIGMILYGIVFPDQSVVTERFIEQLSELWRLTQTMPKEGTGK